jgi:hypothetical protein
VGPDGGGGFAIGEELAERRESVPSGGESGKEMESF